MALLEQTFEELRQHLKGGRSGLDSTGHDPVFYIVYPPERILEMRSKRHVLESKLKNDGYSVVIFSISQAVDKLLSKSDEYQEMLEVENDPDISTADINESVYGILADDPLTNEAPIVKSIIAAIDAAASTTNGLLIITDLEALHPYMKIGGIENTLVNRFKVPTVVLYPGEKSGSYSLKFLGIHVTDGNYRSIHLGG